MDNTGDEQICLQVKQHDNLGIIISKIYIVL